MSDPGLSSVRIPRDIRSKIFRPATGSPLGVIYRTESQVVAVLEGDSAEVWHRIFEQGGQLDRAFDYLLQHGEFAAEPQVEARATLTAFLDSLAEFLVGRSDPSDGISGPVNSDAGRTTERTINLWMADHHILYSLVVELTYRCNERCVHCYCPSQRDGPELSINSLRSLVEEFEYLGGFSLQLTGGELLFARIPKPCSGFSAAGAFFSASSAI